MIKFSRVWLTVLFTLALLVSFGCGGGSSSPQPESERTAQQTEPSSDVGARLEEAGKSLENLPVYFAFDRSVLSNEAKALLNAKAGILKQYPEISVKIEGHCDNRGTEEYNMALGERRAKAAYDYLVMLGVNPSQLSWVSFGELYPAVEGQNEDAWSKNRRDEFSPNIKY
ncbi:MAG: peptidoglycan-associated lipoprotein Pal [Deltaproteobacteria bacterium]|jgi:peptidoglycan-associated lipoprotein|nr:peptidoglycan-associated lipoprotein Pal [Deltaproteobacteria bacterium]